MNEAMALAQGKDDVFTLRQTAPPLPSRSKNHLRPNNDRVLSAHSNLELGPPIPPRAPLKRSLSLTTKPPPPPPNQSGTVDRAPATGFVPLIVDPLRVRTRSKTLTRSAPTLSNINNSSHVVLFSSRGQIKFIPLTSERTDSGTQVVSLARWPLSEAQQRSEFLTIDSLAGKFSTSSNEYVESPGTKSRNRCQNVSNSNSLSSARHLTTLSPHSRVTSVIITSEKKSYGMLQRLRRLVTGKNKQNAGLGSSSDDNSPSTPLTVRSALAPKSLDCSNSIVCRKCGKCRCKDCLKKSSRKFSDVPDKDALVDGLSCMCLVKPIFYHCLKDSDGEEDCSEKPCACCSQPNCMSRWTILTLLLPCLPCLCFYLPLKYVVSSCYDCCGDNTRCSCSSNVPTSSGCKILLESETSSIWSWAKLSNFRSF